MLENARIEFGYTDPHKVEFDHELYQRFFRRKQHFPNYLPEEKVLELLPIILSVREHGRLFCIDGQGRTNGALKHNLPHIPSIQIHGLTRDEEALLFAFINEGARKLTPSEIWKSLASGGAQMAKTILSILDELEIQVKVGGRLTKSDPARMLTCVGSLLWVYKRYDAYHLKQTLHFLLQTWNEPQVLSDRWVVAAAIFLNRMLDRPTTTAVNHLAEVMRGVSREDLMTSYKEKKDRLKKRPNLQVLLAEIMEEFYTDLTIPPAA